MPNAREMNEFAKIIQEPALQLMKRNQNFKPTNMAEILKSNHRNRYKSEDLEAAADLIQQCVHWVPKDRLTAAQALKHVFLAE